MQKFVFFLFLTLYFFEESTLAVNLDAYNSSVNAADIHIEISPLPSNQRSFAPSSNQHSFSTRLNPGSNTLPIPDIEANSTVKIYNNTEVMCQKTYSMAPSKPQLTIVPGGTKCILE